MKRTFLISLLKLAPKLSFFICWNHVNWIVKVLPRLFISGFIEEIYGKFQETFYGNISRKTQIN